MPFSIAFSQAACAFAVLPVSTNNRRNGYASPFQCSKPAALWRFCAVLGERTTIAEGWVRRNLAALVGRAVGAGKWLMLRTFRVRLRSGRNGGSVKVHLYTYPLSQRESFPFPAFGWWPVEKWEGVRGRVAP